MSTYKELLAQRAELEKQIEAARKEALASAIAQVRAIVAEYELTEEDVFSKKAPRAAAAAPRPWPPSTATLKPALPGLAVASHHCGLLARTV